MDITELLLQAQNSNNQIRISAEEILIKEKEENYISFIWLMSNELISEEKPLKTRQLAGLILKNCFSSKDVQIQNKMYNDWLNQEQETRAEIKRILFVSLGSKHKIIRHTTAQIIMNIALLEFINEKWNNFLSDCIHFATTNPENTNIFEGIFTCIGYFLENISQMDIIYEIKEIDQVLQFIVNVLKENPDTQIQKSTLISLYHSIDFSRNVFENQEDCDVLMEVILNGSQHQESSEIQEISFQCFTKIGFLYYKILPRYIDKIYQSSINSIKNDNNASIQAIEFWSTICEEEIKLGDSEEMNHFVHDCSFHLVPIILESIKNQTEYNDPNEWTKSKAASVCLSLISSTIHDEIINYVIPFVEENIKSENFRDQESAIIAFGEILEGISEEKSKTFIEQISSILFELLNHNNPQIRDSTGWTIGKICEINPIAIFPRYEDLVQKLLVLLDDTPDIALNSCWSFLNLANSYSYFQDDPLFDSQFPQILNGLLICTERKDADLAGLRVSAFESLSANVVSAPETCIQIVDQLTTSILEKISNSFESNIFEFQDQTSKYQTQSGLLLVILSSTSRLKEQIESHIPTIFLIINHIFENDFQDLWESCLLIIGSLLNIFEQQIEIFIKPIITQIVNTIQLNNQSNSFSIASAGVIGDLFRYTSSLVEPFFDLIIKSLIQNIQNKSIDLKSKKIFISCIGDSCISLPENSIKYYHLIIPCIKNLVDDLLESQKQKQQIKQSNQEILSSVLYLFFAFISSLNHSYFRRFNQFLIDLIRIIEEITGFEEISEDLIHLTLNILVEMIEKFDQKVKKMIQKPNIIQFLNFIESFDNENIIEKRNYFTELQEELQEQVLLNFMLLEFISAIIALLILYEIIRTIKITGSTWKNLTSRFRILILSSCFLELILSAILFIVSFNWKSAFLVLFFYNSLPIWLQFCTFIFYILYLAKTLYMIEGKQTKLKKYLDLIFSILIIVCFIIVILIDYFNAKSINEGKNSLDRNILSGLYTIVLMLPLSILFVVMGVKYYKKSKDYLLVKIQKERIKYTIILIVIDGSIFTTFLIWSLFSAFEINEAIKKIENYLKNEEYSKYDTSVFFTNFVFVLIPAFVLFIILHRILSIEKGMFQREENILLAEGDDDVIDNFNGGNEYKLFDVKK
ncbi:importin subunit beta-1 [Anaeramoeba ignava]|uniref:Importin subunit beta-1 n=1 Tax=Anaeramoeba ignava TaxID=1746090 RepID=A0A9Q0LME8_ANAIG|nr:importin subunit beta-1 [Anaeramoeba ignava]